MASGASPGSSKVRAAVMDAPGSMRMAGFPVPAVGEETALIDVDLCGICGTDKHIYMDLVKSHPLGMPTKFPIIPGHEIVGRISAIGPRAAKRMSLTGGDLRPGDRVVPVIDLRCGECTGCKMHPGWPTCERGETYGWGITSKDPPHLFGGFAEKMFLLPQTKLARVPDSVPDEVAVYAEVLAVGFTSVARISHSMQLGGEGTSFVGDVVVQGSGPLALAHVIAAKVAGARRIVVVGMPEYRLELMKKFGVDLVIDAGKTDRHERSGRVAEAVGGEGADVVFECTGDPGVVEEGLSYLKPFGYYVVAGIYSDNGMTTTLNVQKYVSGRYATVVGSGGQTEQSYGQALRMMESFAGTIPFEKVVSHQFPLEKHAEAMATAISEKSMKVAFRP
ncbi:MAG: zinc-binding dehydrogenase [Nitrososphaerota archaeon]|jgi:L-iditol 2-dehydrogenase|nr:zinc-binding dehydrogenase [Nitrososphaerota archaeon]